MLIEEENKEKSKEALIEEIALLKDRLNSIENLSYYKDIIDRSSELIYIYNADYKIVEINKAVIKKFGYQKNELIGTTGKFLFDNEKNDYKLLCKKFEEVLSKGKTVKRDVWGKDKQGDFSLNEVVIRKTKHHDKELLIMTARDISQHKEYEEKLVDSEKRYKNLFERNLAGIYRTKINGEIVDCNNAFASILGYDSKEELIGKVNASDLYLDKEHREKNIQKIIQKKSVRSNRIRLLKKDKTPIWVLISTAAIKVPVSDEIEYMEGTFIDITEQVKAEEMLQRSQDSYRLLLDTSPFGIVLHDNGNIIFTNHKAMEMMGVDKKTDITKLTVFDFIHKRDYPLAKERIRRTYAGEDIPFQEYQLKKKDGEDMSVESKSNLIDFQGKAVLQISFHDVSQIKQMESQKLQAQLVQQINESLTRELKEKTKIQKKLIASEDKLKASLMEKEVLLKEVHHRVKNNLQVISSIFNLQKNYSSNQTVRDILIESQNRIKSMAFIHESLYKTVDFARINFSEYAENLCYNLVKSYNSYGKTAELELKLQEVFLNLDFAIPCGLILNELITNAIKYAFDGKEGGVITVKASESKQKVKIVIRDNGVGLPKDINFKDSNTLGFQLVNALVTQLNGKVTLKVNKGTEYEIMFAIK